MIPPQRAQHHGRVVHETFPVPLGRVLGQHLCKGRPLAALPHAHHMVIQLLQKWAPHLVGVLWGQAVLCKAVRERAAGKKRYGAVVMFFYRLAHGPAQLGAVREVMHHAQGRDANHLEMPVCIHVAHGHQRAVFGRERGGSVRQCGNAHVIAGLGQQFAQGRVAVKFIRQVADEMGQLIAGVNALEMRRAVDVIARIDQPMRVEYHDGVHPQRAAAAANFDVAVDGGLAAAFLRAVELAQIHRRHVRDFGGQG